MPSVCFTISERGGDGRRYRTCREAKAVISVMSEGGQGSTWNFLGTMNCGIWQNIEEQPLTVALSRLVSVQTGKPAT